MYNGPSMRLTLGERLLLYRHRHRPLMTSKRLAEIMRVHRRTITRIERGERVLGRKFLRTVEDRFKILEQRQRELRENGQ